TTEGSPLKAEVQKRCVRTTAAVAAGASAAGGGSRPRGGGGAITPEKNPVTPPGLPIPRSPPARGGEANAEENAAGRTRCGAAPEVADLRHRKRHVLPAEARRALADVDQAVFAAIDQGAQQHAAHDAEDRGVGADAEGQGDDDGGDQTLRAEQRAQPHPHVLA